MKPKTLVLIALVITIVYIGFLKVAGLNDLDFNNLFESIKPLIPHSFALMATFIFLVMAYLKQLTSNVVLAIVGSLLSTMTYVPLSLFMLIPAAVLLYTAFVINKH